MKETLAAQCLKSNNANNILDSSVQHIAKKLESVGSMHDLPKSGRTRNPTEELKEKIKEKLEVTPIVHSATGTSIHDVQCDARNNVSIQNSGVAGT